MSNINQLADLPDISFIENMTLQQVQEQLLADYAKAYQVETGEAVQLARADPMRLLLQATALLVYQAMQLTDQAGKQNLLKYAEGEALDNLAALKNCARLPARSASTILRFEINAQSSVVGIPGGTRAATEDGVYFMTTEYAEIQAGSQSTDIPAVAMEAGKAANGYLPGTVSVIVDPLPYVVSVGNTTETAGGSNIETDAELTARVYAAPGAYSVAGPKNAYEYHALQFRADVADARAFSPAPDEVTVLFLLDGGKLPSENDLREMEDYLSDETKRPLCDKVTAAAPEESEYEIRFTYYINRSAQARAAAIQAAVAQAVEEYAGWQRALGRDINPSELIYRAIAAGAKRVALEAPVYTTVEENKIACLTAKSVTYGGLEDD